MRFLTIMFLTGVMVAGCTPKDVDPVALGANFEKPDSALMRKAADPKDLPKGAGLGVCTVEYAELRRQYSKVADRNTFLQKYVSRVTGAKQSTPKKGASTSAPTS